MRVDSKPFTSSVIATAPKRTDTSFKVEQQTSQSSNAGAVHVAQPMASMDAILTLQAEEDPKHRKKRHVKKGHDLLDALNRLKAALLMGRVPASELQMIASRLSERKEASGDLMLDDLVEQIYLRAQVEMAKLDSINK